jgi:hypothetical protein
VNLSRGPANATSKKPAKRPVGQLNGSIELPLLDPSGRITSTIDLQRKQGESSRRYASWATKL